MFLLYWCHSQAICQELSWSARCQSSQLRQQGKMKATVKPLFIYCPSIRKKLNCWLPVFHFSPWNSTWGRPAVSAHLGGIGPLLREPQTIGSCLSMDLGPGGAGKPSRKVLSAKSKHRKVSSSFLFPPWGLSLVTPPPPIRDFWWRHLDQECRHSGKNGWPQEPKPQLQLPSEPAMHW